MSSQNLWVGGGGQRFEGTEIDRFLEGRALDKHTGWGQNSIWAIGEDDISALWNLKNKPPPAIYFDRSLS